MTLPIVLQTQRYWEVTVRVFRWIDLILLLLGIAIMDSGLPSLNSIELLRLINLIIIIDAHLILVAL